MYRFKCPLDEDSFGDVFRAEVKLAEREIFELFAQV